MKRACAAIAALIALTAVVIVSLRGVNWPRTGAALREGGRRGYVAAIVFNSLILVCWAAYWRLLRPADESAVSYSRNARGVVGIVVIDEHPAVRRRTCVERVAADPPRGKPHQRGALSVLALDQLGEGIVKVAVLLVVGLVVPLPAWMRAALATVSLVVGAWFVTLVIAARWTRELETHTKRASVALRRWRA